MVVSQEDRHVSQTDTRTLLLGFASTLYNTHEATLTVNKFASVAVVYFSGYIYFISAKMHSLYVEVDIVAAYFFFPLDFANSYWRMHETTLTVNKAKELQL